MLTESQEGCLLLLVKRCRHILDLKSIPREKNNLSPQNTGCRLPQVFVIPRLVRVQPIRRQGVIELVCDWEKQGFVAFAASISRVFWGVPSTFLPFVFFGGFPLPPSLRVFLGGPSTFTPSCFLGGSLYLSPPPRPPSCFLGGSLYLPSFFGGVPSTLPPPFRVFWEVPHPSPPAPPSMQPKHSCAVACVPRTGGRLPVQAVNVIPPQRLALFPEVAGPDQRWGSAPPPCSLPLPPQPPPPPLQTAPPATAPRFVAATGKRSSGMFQMKVWRASLASPQTPPVCCMLKKNLRAPV